MDLEIHGIEGLTLKYSTLKLLLTMISLVQYEIFL